MEEQGFVYLADSYADDLPYWLDGPHGLQLVVPYTLDANDMRFATPQGFNSGDQFFAYLKDSFDLLHPEGAERPKMMSVGLHCRLAGRPGRAAAFARFLDYALEKGGVWMARRLDIARHWIVRHPPPNGYRPSRMPRALFLERFGDVFEHTPKIAESVHRAGLSSRHDDAQGLAASHVRGDARFAARGKARLDQGASRSCRAPRARRRGHGRQRQGAGRCGTRSSLTPHELAALTRMNEHYKAHFGFPFILAVKGCTKEEVIAAMRDRLGADAEAEFETALGEIERIAQLQSRTDCHDEQFPAPRRARDAAPRRACGRHHEAGKITRLFLSPSHKLAMRRVRGFMEAAGLAVEEDDIGNVVGRLKGPPPTRRSSSSAPISTACETRADMTAASASSPR